MSAIKSKIIFGKEEKIQMVDRYFIQTAEAAMRGEVIRGLVELITNCDDSYIRLKSKGEKASGEIFVSVQRKNKGKSIIEIKDYAEGMTLAEMVEKLRRAGGTTSGYIESRGKMRGLMGRGSKECVVLGNLRYRSIKLGVYSEIRLKRPAVFVREAEHKATLIERVETGIKKGNGTVITWEIEEQFKTPLHETLAVMLTKYFSLRDIMSSNNRTVYLIDKNKNKKELLKYERPEGKLIFDDYLTLPIYSKARVHLRLYKIEKRIKVDSGSPYWEGGVLVQSSYALHEVTGFTKEIENNIPYFEHYLGRLTCPFIDELVMEYEDAETNKRVHSKENPQRLINPMRFGLERGHPFAKELYSEAAKQLSLLLKSDEERAKSEIKDIENKKTKTRMKKLASEVSKFIKENTEDQESLKDDFYLSPNDIPANGFKVIPEGLKLYPGQEARVYAYAKPGDINTDKHVEITNISDSITVSSDIINLINRGDGLHVNHFLVRGDKLNEKVSIILKWGSIEKIVRVSVVEKTDYPEIDDIQFEKDNYSLKENKKKNIIIVAKWPEFISGRIKLNIIPENEKYFVVENKSAIIDYNKKLKDKSGRRVATCVVRLKGIKSGGPIILKTQHGGKEISTKIRVVPKDEFGPDFEIKIVDEDLGEQRAMLKNNLLKINGRHKNIKRYLGSAEENFPGQDSIHFRLLIAELIAETVARRVVESNAQSLIEYRDLDASAFYRKHRDIKNKFLQVAHIIQVPEPEIMTERKS